MKKLVPVFAFIAVVLFVAPQARTQEMSVNFFYDNLSGGSWFEVGDYGYCWQPDVAANSSTWRPYADGYWAYTEEGWTWVSYEDFGWATYHYGRWVKLADYGWVWKPGYEWGPAWVSWRTGGNYIGWAPLPPETESIYESRPLTGHIDAEFDIGPACYNFVDVRYIGEPVLRSRLVPYQQNVTYVTQTVNVTNITYKNKTVYSYGPDINVLNQYSSRPIQRLKLERPANVDVSVAAKSGGLTKVQGNALVVAAPARINKSAGAAPPPSAKAKVAQAKVEKGWSVAGDANAQSQLKEKLKSEDLNKVPPPTLGAASSSGAAPSAFEKGKGKNKNKAAGMQSAGPADAATSPAANMASPERRKKKGKNTAQVQPGEMTSPAAGAETEMSPSVTPDSGKPGKRGKNRRGEQSGGTPLPTGSARSPEATTAPEEKGKQKKFEKQQQPGMSPADQSSTSDRGSDTGPTPESDANSGVNRRGKNKADKLNGPPPPIPIQTNGAQIEGTQGGKYLPDQEVMKHRRPEASPAQAQQGEAKQQGKKQGADQPSPTPQ